MLGFATVSMAGRLTDDPEVRFRTSGEPVASFCVEVRRTIRSEFHSREWVDYLDCIRVGDDAEDVRAKFHKGDAVEICGRLTQRRWEERGHQRKCHVVEVATISRV